MIRNFIYLDSDKLRSLSSQLFEGVTEYVLESESHSEQQKTDQKGPVGSGRVLADILRQGGSSTSLKFLEDHAYVLFEDYLVGAGQVDIVQRNGEQPKDLERPFIRVCGPTTFNDVSEILNLVDNFNEFGEALFRMTHQEDVALGNKGKALSDGDVRARAKQLGMQIDPKFLKSIRTALSYGYQDLFEVQITVQDYLFSAPLKRGNLRENEAMLVKKFSRQSQVAFTMLGVVTQRGGADADPPPSQLVDFANLKQAMRVMVDNMRQLEGTFSAPEPNEIVVDPVAIYMEV